MIGWYQSSDVNFQLDEEKPIRQRVDLTKAERRRKSEEGAACCVENGDVPLNDSDLDLTALSRGRLMENFDIDEAEINLQTPSIAAVPSIECGPTGKWKQSGVPVGVVRPFSVVEPTSSMDGETSGESPPPDRNSIPPPLPPRKHRGSSKVKKAPLDLSKACSMSELSSMQVPVVNLSELQVPEGLPPRENQASFDSMEAFAGSQENMHNRHGNSSSSGANDSEEAAPAQIVVTSQVVTQTASNSLEWSFGGATLPGFLAPNVGPYKSPVQSLPMETCYAADGTLPVTKDPVNRRLVLVQASFFVNLFSGIPGIHHFLHPIRYSLQVEVASFIP
ncbi:hypothetical protein CAPTEDRAFT_199104 [Capitella teleta]|uniref:Uncharacterized protein n=1 Tax=Capitella teleta TaxID=283909 RepID=R7V516_CAPTE|nr:hypothetical protein CAPTEDRAFT_199104 [Capitella teleta]|eukprot:ELU13953.1 hypothetical protein CAPTEDRAFT_199104 [Capitella teleta]